MTVTRPDVTGYCMTVEEKQASGALAFRGVAPGRDLVCLREGVQVENDLDHTAWADIGDLARAAVALVINRKDLRSDPQVSIGCGHSPRSERPSMLVDLVEVHPDLRPHVRSRPFNGLSSGGSQTDFEPATGVEEP